MKFCWCTITVEDMEKSLKFYKEIIGLKVDRRLFSGADTDICFLGDGETKIELVYRPNQGETVSKEGISIGFEVESLDKTMEFVREKGIAVDKGPFQPNEHVRFFYIRDPNGVSVQFVENL